MSSWQCVRHCKVMWKDFEASCSFVRIIYEILAIDRLSSVGFQYQLRCEDAWLQHFSSP